MDKRVWLLCFGVSFGLVACGGSGGDSATQPQAGQQLVVPSAPDDLTVVAGTQTVTLQWSTVPNATSYNVYASPASGAGKDATTKINTVNPPYTFSSLSAGTYYFTVTAVNDSGESSVSPEVSASVQLVAFITSTSGNGSLSSWPDAGGQVGLAAADAICQARANAGGRTGTFRAWLSDNSSDAYCRVHNLSGKKSTNCGQTTLPMTAGPWVRTDGVPFRNRIDQNFFGQLYVPIRYDEYGNMFGWEAYYYSNTNAFGVANGSSACADWTNRFDPNSAGAGSSEEAWMWGGFGSSCDNNFQHLLCMQTDNGPDMMIAANQGKKVFVSSQGGKGNLSAWSGAGGRSGVAAGDAVCQSLAANAGLANSPSFKAWLSDGSVKAVDRLVSDGPWVRVDGVKVADNKTDLVDGSLFTSIGVNEFGGYEGMIPVWTGTTSSGIPSWNCNAWTDATALYLGANGRGSAAGTQWADSGALMGCNMDFFRLYCFED